MITVTQRQAGLILQVACAWKSDMCIIWFVLLMCCRFYVAGTLSGVIQVRADRTFRKEVCNYLQKSEAHVQSDILTQHWITM
jgi:hypothetical protein